LDALERLIWWFYRLAAEVKAFVCLRMSRPGFSSGRSFETPGLSPEGKFMAAGKYYCNVEEVNREVLGQWLVEASTRQWDYKNIVKRKGVLEKPGDWQGV
jgi:hypothetical protein